MERVVLTLSGMVMLVKPEQAVNVPSLIEVTLSGIVILVRLVQRKKA